MGVPSLKSLSEATDSYLSERKSDCFLVELGSDDRPISQGGKAVTLAFQYFPDTISDSKAINYSQKEIPGGSLPLYQWMNGGERLITFTAMFTTDVDLLIGSAQKTGALANFGRGEGDILDRLQAAGEGRRNVDIRSAIVWLRRYMLPSYQSVDNAGVKGTTLTHAPSKLLLGMPNSGIGLSGGDSGFTSSPDSVVCVMTQCDVTYEAFFPSGLPRVASVSLAFAQVPQFGGFVQFPHRGVQMDNALHQANEGSPPLFFGYNLIPRTKRGGS